MKITSTLFTVVPALIIMNAAAYGQADWQQASTNTNESLRESSVCAASLSQKNTLIAGVPFAPVPLPSASCRVLTPIAQPRPLKGLPGGQAGAAQQTKVQSKRVKAVAEKPVTRKKAAAKKILSKEEAAKIAAARKEAEATRIISSTVASKSRTTDEKWVSLTFDDGPHPAYTPQILALLKKYEIHATFCLLGRQVKKYPELVKQIIAEGHKVADHSMNHDERLSYRADKKIKKEILGEKELIQSVVPDTPVEFYRAPGGVWNYHIRKLVSGWGMKPLGWSVDSRDWCEPGVEAIVSTVKGQLHSGAVILMHDAGGNRSQTVQALKQLIPTLIKEGYQFGFPG